MHGLVLVDGPWDHAWTMEVFEKTGKRPLRSTKRRDAYDASVVQGLSALASFE